MLFGTESAETEEDEDVARTNGEFESQRLSDEDQQDLDEELVDHDVPASAPTPFAKMATPRKNREWAPPWDRLEDAGWTWKKGGGLVSFNYLRPGVATISGAALGQDYFDSREAVVEWVNGNGADWRDAHAGSVSNVGVKCGPR